MGLARILILLALCGASAAQSFAQSPQVIELEGDVRSEHLAQYLVYARDYDGQVSLDQIESRIDTFETLDEDRMFFGRDRTPILIVFGVRNPTELTQTWFLRSNRHIANSLQILSLGEEGVVTLFDTSSSIGSNTHHYLSFGGLVSLAPGETRYIAINSDFENTGNIEFDILSSETFFGEYHSRLFTLGSIAAALLTVILLNLALFTATSRAPFLWLSLAEACLLYNFVHSSGLLFSMGLYQFPLAQYVAMQVIFWLMGSAFLQFWRGVLNTKQDHPLIDRGLRFGILGCAVLMLGWIASYFGDSSIRYYVGLANWVGLLPIGLSMPVFGFLTVRKLGAAYWPLFVGVSLYSVISVVLFLEIIILGTHRFHAPTIFGITGVLECFLITLSLSWGIYLTTRERAELFEEKVRLSEQNSLASATIRDQTEMLQTSGHDTRQVLLAINSATEYMDRSKGVADKRLVDTLKASAAYLNDILSTTLSARRTHAAAGKIIALSGFSVDEFFRSLSQIYVASFRQKGIALVIKGGTDFFLISDRALLMRAISNLISNSLAATESGRVECRAELTGRDLTITIADSGRGISPELLNFLMDSGAAPKDLVRSPSGFKIATDIIHRLQGELSITSQPGRGTTIRIVLPCGFDGLKTSDQTAFEHLIDDQITDLDAGSQASKTGAIGTTFDDSSLMRERAASAASLILYKPLYVEMQFHPLVNAVKSAP